MIKYLIAVGGMRCGMCKAHVNDIVRRALPVKKVSSSYRKGLTTIVSEEVVEEEKIKSLLEKEGYIVKAINIKG